MIAKRSSNNRIKKCIVLFFLTLLCLEGVGARSEVDTRSIKKRAAKKSVYYEPLHVDQTVIPADFLTEKAHINDRTACPAPEKANQACPQSTFEGPQKNKYQKPLARTGKKHINNANFSIQPVESDSVQ